MIAAIAFYVFAAVLIGSAALVVSSRNPVHSVLFLILAFFNAAGLFLLAGAEFLAMVLVIVYVGAVAVLFLFVVMMLDVNFDQMREGVQRYAPIGAAVGAVLFLELIVTVAGWQFVPNVTLHLASATPAGVTNTAALGHLIYTDYIFLFQAAGLILLVAMIGAIVLTHRERGASRRQNIGVQQARTMANTLEMMTVAIGAGSRQTGILRPLPPPARPLDDHDDHGHGGHDDGHGHDDHAHAGGH
ncbi:NADH-quinone oxidoreductase subunit J [Acidisphaera sp. L21]|jgi:NADH-quinone oxidoreductase subunit J|uniref:NADH-quinone oxidoreductase subunit J n=1 Tax=Acidisphaera sp. L21 TaxID=1641851 RepID=UPI00131AD5A0|nr:NADH-quinone oxidoreductase subunit J [Acidisphaera sp. L21]